MAVPTAPTKSTILTEAYKRCGIPSPTTAQLLRAEDEWLGEVLREIASEKRWHVMEATQVQITTAYQGVYTIPSPLIRVSEIRFFDGGTKGTASAGAASTITVESGTDADLGLKIFLTGGTGSGQVSRVISRSGNVYTVSPSWSTTPGATTTYMIASVELDLDGPHTGIPRTSGTGYPKEWEEFEGEIYVYPVPTLSTYAFEVKGQADIELIDETSTRYTTILREWRPAIIQGVRSRIMEDLDDSGQVLAEQKFEGQKRRAMRQDSRNRRSIYGGGLKSFGGLPSRW